MKNWLKISMLSLAISMQAINASPLLLYTSIVSLAPFLAAKYRSTMDFGKNFNPSLDNLNVFTLIPTTQHDASQSLSSINICEVIKDGRRDELHGRYVAIDNKCYQISCDIPDNCTSIVVHNAGYDGYAGSAPIKFAWAGKEATNLFKNNLIPENTPVVCFEGPVNYPSTFSFGGEFDQKCLDFVYEKTKEKNPKASIILSGDCKGATGVLNYLINQEYKSEDKLTPIKAVILESPSSSLTPLTQNVAENHVPTGLQWIIPIIFKSTFHNCKWDQPTILDKASDFPTHTKVHIGYLKRDKTASPRDTAAIVTALRAAGKTVESFEHDDASLSHGHLGQSTGYQKSVRTFLDKIVKK